MKQINTFSARLRGMAALLLLGVLPMVLTSCGDDDATGEAAKTVTIVSSDLLFEPVGRTGTVEVQAAGPVVALLESDWCSATVSGQVVSVAVADNNTFEGRTALLTIQADGAEIVLPVQQRGMALGSMPVSDANIGNAGGHLSYYIRHDLPFTLSTEEDWIHATMEGDSLLIDIDPNDALFLRRGVLEYDCAGYGGQLDIVQYDLETIIGEWYLGGTMAGASTGFRFWLTKEGSQYYMTLFRMEEWAKTPLPVDFDETRCELILHNVQQIYSNSNATYTFYFFTRDNTISNSPDATLKGRIYYNPFATSVGGSHYASLEDGLTWGNGDLAGLLIYMQSLFASTVMVQLSDPYIIWLGPITEENS